MPSIGLECAGVVTEVGADVTGAQVGDEVIVYPVTAAYADYVTAPATSILPNPLGSGGPRPARGRTRAPRSAPPPAGTSPSEPGPARYASSSTPRSHSPTRQQLTRSASPGTPSAGSCSSPDAVRIVAAMTVAPGQAHGHDHAVLPWLAQTQAPEAGGWTVTTFIALAGAVISLATLAVTTWASGQRERAKWARETLAEAFFDFVDTSYTAANATTALYRGMFGGAAPDARAEDLGEVERQHSLLRHHLTKIRLLAPATTVERAQALRRAHSDFVAAVGPDLEEDHMRRLREEVARAREGFIASAKKAMSLPR
jgi:hypothetical protein